MRDLLRWRTALAAAGVVVLGAAGAASAGGAPAPGAVDRPDGTDGAKASVSSSTDTARVIVRASGGTDSAAQAVQAAGGRVLGRIDIIGGVSAEVPASSVAALRASQDVQQVSDDAPIAAPVAAADGGADWSVTPAQAAHLVGADALARRGITGQGVDVAVLDTGVVPVAGLDGTKVVNGPDLSLDSQIPGMRSLDAYGHGTHMSGIIAGADADPAGFRGVAPGARIVNVKVGAADGAVDVSQVLAGIDWVVQHKSDNGLNIKVLNISFGTDSAQDPALDPLVYAAEVAWQQGIVVVASVGNDGKAAHGVADPAVAPSVIAVGAADTRGSADPEEATTASYSSVGDSRRHADLLAPGTHVLSLRSPGSWIDSAFPLSRRGDRYTRGSGTSQAAAVVSGSVALLLQARPELRPDEVKALLLKTATRLRLGHPQAQGAGLLDVGQAAGARIPKRLQDHAALTGTGSLEGSRGSTHVANGGLALTGEQDIFGHAFSSAAWAPLSLAGNSWSGGTWNGNSWSGNSWSGNSWSGNSWSGNSWSGNSWSGNSWSGNSWSGNSWSGNSWSGNSWSGNSWSGNSWSGNSWSGNSWSGNSWSGNSWSGNSWSGNSWSGAAWLGHSWR